MASVFFIQQNFTVGDIDGNARLIRTAAAAAADSGAAVALTPELALLGYPAEDVLYSPAIRNKIETTLPQLAAALPPAVAVVVGTPLWENNTLYNGAVLIRGGAVEAVYKKAHLPNYSVFDEKRYFSEHANPPLVFNAGGCRYAVQICQDIWIEEQLPQLAATGAEAILVPNGSPFVVGKQTLRHTTAAACARRCNAAVFYANAVGAQDELIFDGASFKVEKDGTLSGQLPAFSALNDFADSIVSYPEELSAIYQALVGGIRDYVAKSGFAEGIVLGLSGGIDSALVAALAVEAVGSDKVCAVMMPTQYTSDMSLHDARTLANNLGITYLTLPLGEPLAAMDALISPHLMPRQHDVTHENLQARLRGTLLMAIANNRNLLLLATGNKSEIACGYATLYGDMNGGFAPIKDILKTQVWALAHYYNQQVHNAIPERIITRPPSAELRPGQTDQDSLPPYDILDAIISDHLVHRPRTDMEAAYGSQYVADFYRRLAASEYKRRQAPLGTKVSNCAFGRDWRMPVANGYAAS